jgi:hypothetical protein
MNMSPDDAADSMDDLHRRIEHLDLHSTEALSVEAVQSNIDNADSLYEPRVFSIYDDGHALLNKTGAMRAGVRGSVQVSGEGFEVSITNDENYGTYINEGTGRMPARPFAEVPEETLDQIQDMIADQLLGD